MSTQLSANWHTDSLGIVIVTPTSVSRYQNFCMDGGTSPEYVGNTLITSVQQEQLY
jgi:hypothetical protein